MITIRDWIATIPDTDKHIAYVGEESSVFREFLLTGADWNAYRNWTFYLDMAFDLSSVTTRDRRQVVATQQDVTETVSENQTENNASTTEPKANSSEMTGQTQVKTSTSGKKETYTVETVQVNAPAKTDVVYLTKQEREDGLYLRWKVLAQHTQLPGKLTATLRAMGTMGEVKKSALMVFEVDPAVVAEPAAPISRNTFELMLDEMSASIQIGYEQAQQTAQNAMNASAAATQAAEAFAATQMHAVAVERHQMVCDEMAQAAMQAAETAGAHSQRAEEDAELAVASAAAAEKHAADTARHAEAAALYAATAKELAVTALGLDKATATRDCYISATGSAVGSVQWRSYLFTIPATDVCTVDAAIYSNSATFYAISFYDIDTIDAAHFLGGVLSRGGAQKNVFTDIAVPEGTALVVISSRRGTGTDETGTVWVPTMAVVEQELATMQTGIGQSMFTVRERILGLENTVDAIQDEMAGIRDNRVFGKGNVRAVYRDVPNNNDFTVVGDEVWFAQDYNNICHLHRYRFEGDTLVPIETNILTDFGHWNSVDYNDGNDCLVFGNGANDTVTEGNFFAVVPHPRAITGSATLDTHAIRYPVDIGYKVQAVWGDSNLGKNNIVYLLSDNAKTITKVLLKQNEDGSFYKDPNTGCGEYSILETGEQSTHIGVGGSDFWGDTLYIGDGDYHGYKEMSMTDYSVKSVSKSFYRDDGTKISGSTQGIHVDSDYLWVYYNVAFAIQERQNESYLIQYYR